MTLEEFNSICQPINEFRLYTYDINCDKDWVILTEEKWSSYVLSIVLEPYRTHCPRIIFRFDKENPIIKSIYGSRYIREVSLKQILEYFQLLGFEVIDGEI